ncbi:hypothetical protein PENSTE_c010G01338 [Penicillium steckii]|uniref:DUF3669 domain-containing protein n=1 Tax=Penicillium steckii TaxID=303698 RepID=A0A1V6T8J8_9EURO|nr:hypothetical protein PENSTE_c010G01338 [Penicillium steckii]
MAQLNGNGNGRPNGRHYPHENGLFGLVWYPSTFDNMPDFVTLACTLDPGAVVQTYSSFALLQDQHVSHPDLQLVKHIRSGRQGTVFEHISKPYVIKKENPTWVEKGTEFTIRREYFDNLVPAAAAFTRFRKVVKTMIRVPTPLGFVSDTDTQFWDDVLPKLPLEHRTRGNVILMEHILPLAKVTRKALFSFVYGRRNLTSGQVNDLVNDPNNKQCLIHPYLGMDDNDVVDIPEFHLSFEWLRKVGMEMLQLSVYLGRAYAILHWGAGIDGRGVKLVLGTRCVEGEDNIRGFQNRSTELYFIDFGECTQVNLAEDEYLGVYDVYIKAMLSETNALIIPPISRRPGYFGGFRDAYCETSQFILQRKDLQDKFNGYDFMNRYRNAYPDSDQLHLPGNAFRSLLASAVEEPRLPID